MTATARVWEAEGEASRLVASMAEDSPVFGPVAYKLKLSEAVRLGLVAPYQVVCLDIRDPELHAALTSTSEGAGSPAVRGARLAAVQTGLMRAAVEERFRRVLSFHSRIGEAEAMAAGVPSRSRPGSPRMTLRPSRWRSGCGRTGCTGSTRLSTAARSWTNSPRTFSGELNPRAVMFRLLCGC